MAAPRRPDDPTHNQTSRLTWKRCERCRLTFSMEAFARDISSATGHQSWCRRCKADWERGPGGAWKRFRAWLAENEPNSLSPPYGWTEELYIARWNAQSGLCETCGARLDEWQVSGHRQDRIDNDSPHIPANCRLLCWPCNRRKSNRNPHAADKEIARWVEEYGRGRVPWQTIDTSLRRVELPNVERFRVDPAQLDLFGSLR